MKIETLGLVAHLIHIAHIGPGRTPSSVLEAEKEELVLRRRHVLANSK